MGGGDLNLKKSWHPLTYQNQERIWKEEQNALEEKKKLDQLRKELEEERQIQELQRLKDAKRAKKTDRLDWMYATATGQAANNQIIDQEEFLLGKRRVDCILKPDVNPETLSSSSTTVFVNAINMNANTLRDTQAKIREDPLFAIKKQEQASLQSIMNNPLKMKELQEMKSKSKHKKEKNSRKEKDSKHSQRAQRHSRSVSPRDRNRHSSSRRERDSENSRHHHHHHHSKNTRYDTSSSKNQNHTRHDTDRSRTSNHDKEHMHQERLKRLKEMQDDAERVEIDRRNRLDRMEQEDAEKEKKEQEEREKTGRNQTTSQFIKETKQSAYSSTRELDLGERLRRNRAMLSVHQE